MQQEMWKENRFSGRDASGLAEYIELVSAGHPDPLCAYLPYISDAKTNLLLPVLSKFMASAQYQNDPRYIKLWIIYADSTSHPSEIYQSLLSRGIGKLCSILYVALADIYESQRFFELSELSYLQGLFCSAEPFSRLSEAYASFQAKNLGPSAASQPISVEEKRTIVQLRRTVRRVASPQRSPERSPEQERAANRIHMSACKQTPDIDKLYHSPNENRYATRPPGLVHGRIPLGFI
jgi:hypothetical protein